MGATRGVALLMAMCVVATAGAAMADSFDMLEVFAGQDKSARVGMYVIFNDAKLVRPDPPDPDTSYSFAWDFDDRRDLNLDGTMDNDNETTTLLTEHTFTVPGTFTVTLWVYDSTGRKAKDTCTVTVVENLPPEIQVSETHTAYVNVPYTFQATATDDYSPEHMLRWEWDFGDGVKSNDPPPVTHTYNTLRAYQVRVRVFDPEQLWSEKTLPINVVERPGESGTVYAVEDGALAQSKKQIQEDGYIVYSLAVRKGHDIHVDITSDPARSPIAALVFRSEAALLDYELGIRDTWDRDLSEVDMMNQHRLEWTGDVNGTLFIVLDNGFMGNDPFGMYTGVAVVNVTIEDIDRFADEVPPTVVLEGPSEGSEVEGVVELRGTAADDRNVTVIELRVDDGEWTEAGNGTGWSYELDTADLPEGTHTVEVRAFDGTHYSVVNGLEFTVVRDEITTPRPSWTPFVLIALVGAAVAMAYAASRRR